MDDALDVTVTADTEPCNVRHLCVVLLTDSRPASLTAIEAWAQHTFSTDSESVLRQFKQAKYTTAVKQQFVSHLDTGAHS